MIVGTPASILGYGALTAVVLGVCDYTGGGLKGHGFNKNEGDDEFERREHLRTNRRKPIGQVFEDIGEGRGIYAPGYAERRAERIKEKYGIEVPSS